MEVDGAWREMADERGWWRSAVDRVEQQQLMTRDFKEAQTRLIKSSLKIAPGKSISWEVLMSIAHEDQSWESLMRTKGPFM